MRSRKSLIFLATLLLLSVSPVHAKETKKPNQAPVVMKEMVVSATRTEKKVDDAPASVTVITKEDMEKYNIQTLDDAIKYEAGLYVRHTKGLADPMPRINMRGLYGPNRNLVLLDGIPINGGYTGEVAWNNLGLDNIERIEVIRGPGSALYGGNAMGGVINIITSTPKKLEAGAHIGYGSDDTIGYGVSVGDRFFDRLALRVGFNGEETSGYATSLVERSIRNGSGTLHGGYPMLSSSKKPKWVVGDKGDNPAERWNVNLKAAYDVRDTGRLNFDFQYGHHEYDYDEPHTYLTDANGNPSFSGKVDIGGGKSASVYPSSYIYYTGKGDKDFAFCSLTYKDSFGILDFTGKVAYENRDNWYTVSTGRGSSNYDNSPGNLSESNTDSWLTDIQLNLPLGSKHILTFGFYFRTDDFDNDGYDLSYYRDEDSKISKTETTKGKDRFYAFYLQDQWKLLDNLSLYAGMRVDYWEAFDGEAGPVGSVEEFDELSDYGICPKFSAVWNPFKDTYVRASIGRAFRAPTIYELYRTWVGSSATYHSNPDLDPETLWNYETGFDQYLFNRRVKLAATYFHTELDDMIETYYIGRDQYRDNVSSAKIDGVELEAYAYIFDWLKLWGNYTYNRTEVLENDRNPDAEGNYLPGTPARIINVGTELTYKWIKGSISGQYLGRIYKTELNNDEDDVYGGNTKCWLWDAKVSLNGGVIPALIPSVHQKPPFELSFSVENLFDRDYFESYVGRGRSYYGEIRFKW